MAVSPVRGKLHDGCKMICPRIFDAVYKREISSKKLLLKDLKRTVDVLSFSREDRSEKREKKKQRNT